MAIHEDLFDNDERVLINHLVKGENLGSYKKENLIQSLMFQQSILSEESDIDVVELVTATLSKVNLLTDDEWEEIKKHIPLPCLDEDLFEDVV